MIKITDIQTALALKLQVQELTEQILSLKKWLTVLIHKDAALSVTFKLSGVEAVKESPLKWDDCETFQAANERFALRLKRGGTIYMEPDEASSDEIILHKFTPGGSIRLLKFLLAEKQYQRNEIMMQLEKYVSDKKFVQHETDIDDNNLGAGDYRQPYSPTEK